MGCRWNLSPVGPMSSKSICRHCFLEMGLTSRAPSAPSEAIAKSNRRGGKSFSVIDRMIRVILLPIYTEEIIKYKI